MLIKRFLASVIDFTLCASIFIAMHIVNQVKMNKEWNEFNEQYQLLEENLLNELGITEKYWQELFRIDNGPIDMMDPKFPIDLFLEYVQGDKIIFKKNVIQMLIWLPFIIFFPLIYSLYIFLSKRTIGQRIFNLEFYTTKNRIYFWKNIFIRSFCIFWITGPIFLLSIINKITKNNLYLLDDISGLYVRRYQKNRL